MKTTLINNFHDTEITVVAKPVSPGIYSLSVGQVRKIRKALCGMDGCTCGDFLGQRGTEGLATF